MPIYEYECPKCFKKVEEVRSISEDSTFCSAPCFKCLEPMKKVISLVVGKVRGGTPKLTGTLKDKNVG